MKRTENMIKPMENTKFGEIAIKNARRAHHGDPSTTKNKPISKNISAIMSILYRKSELKTRIMLQEERNCKIRAGVNPLCPIGEVCNPIQISRFCVFLKVKHPMSIFPLFLPIVSSPQPVCASADLLLHLQ